MTVLPSSVLDDVRYRVPDVPPAASGVAWLRAHVVRFCEGEVHTRRRCLVEGVLADLSDFPYDARVGSSPTARLLAGLGLPAELEPDVALVAAAYQPHTPQSPDADAAADRLVAACGGRTEAAAAQACVLVQAHTATLVLAEAMRTGSNEPPVPHTRRIAPDGTEVLVDLTDASFGRGPHRCPGERIALGLAEDLAHDLAHASADASAEDLAQEDPS